MTPPAAIKPMSDEICKTSFIMACPDDTRPLAVYHPLTDLAVATKSRRGRKNNVVSDDAVVTDMADIHEITAIPDARNAAAGHGPGVHGHLLPERAALADLKAGESAAIAQRLRRRAERNEG